MSRVISSLLVTLGNGFSKRHSPGCRSAWMCAAAAAPYGSTIEHLTKYVAKQTIYSMERLPTQMVTKKAVTETVSVFNGPAPQFQVADSESDESEFVANWIIARADEGVTPEEIALIARSEPQLARCREAVKLASDLTGKGFGAVSVLSMHGAKGLEFRSVCVMACDDDVIPLESRIRAIGDQADLEDIYNTERHLLYVACTRARDHLLVTGVDPVSEFLDDLR